MRLAAFADSAGSTLFVTLRRLRVGCCSLNFDASVAANNGALQLTTARRTNDFGRFYRIVLTHDVS
jgi:hypothetical protein